MKERSASEKLALFRSLFTGLPGVYGTYDPSTGRVRQVKEPVTDQVLLAHLKGEQPYGVYLLMGDTIRALAVDFDTDELCYPLDFQAGARRHNLSTCIERSKSKGYHVWMFFEEKGVPARKARLVTQSILVRMDKRDTEIFPKHDALDEHTQYGNFINAPLFGAWVLKGRTVFVDPAAPMEVHPDQWGLLESVRRHVEKDLDGAIEQCQLQKHERTQAQIQPSSSPRSPLDTSAFGLPPCARKILAEGVSSHQRVSCFRLAVHLKRSGIPHDLALVMLKAWAKKNRPTDGRRVITDQEIDYQTRCAFERPYRSFGCEHAAMAAYCHQDCPLHSHTVGKPTA
jgi:hypothetical protein